MFIDDQFSKSAGASGGESGDHKKTVFIFIVFCIVLLVIIVGVFFGFKMMSGDEEPGNGGEEKQKEEQKTSTTTELGGDNQLPDTGDKGDDKIEATTSVEAEKLRFGDFYESGESDFETDFANYELPLNVKTDVSNYYELNRKIDLEKKLFDLNNNGFTIIENPFNDSDTFFSSYRKLESEGVPIVITKDFLNYYYQNTLKNNYKEIEKVIFYENLWDINKYLYKVAKRRYTDLKKKKGLTSDPMLEAARRETAFFATTLKLLQPGESQINREKISKPGKFSGKEAGEFYIELPGYLRDDVIPEVNLIENGVGEKIKSPVLLYRRDYGEFKVPESYEKDARLRNFYLASGWLNSNFPLFHKSEKCPDCILDKADWRVNMLTSLLISEDFSAEQSIKNEWAQIYKMISFFKGLRDQLIYLDYVSALENEMGQDFDLTEEFWSKDLEVVDNKLNKIKENIVDNLGYTEIEGTLQNTTSSRPFIGLRVLSENYTPNEYIYNNLIYPKVGEYRGDERIKSHLVCDQGDVENVRCNSFHLDVVNLIKSLENKNSDFDRYKMYNDYDEQVKKIKRQLNNFDKYTWHKSNYWSQFFALDNSVRANKDLVPPYTKTEAWLKRDVNLISGALADTQLSPDTLSIYTGDNKKEGFSSVEGYNNEAESKKYNYIEPSPVFVKEMRSNVEMLIGMLESLGITKRLYRVKSNLREFDSNLARIENIMQKELKGEKVTKKDHEFISDFAGHFEVDKKGNKELYHEKALSEELKGVKILILVYRESDGKKVFTAGPVYNHQSDVKD